MSGIRLTPFLASCMMLISTVAVVAQMPVLKGRVIPADSRYEDGWDRVEVTVKHNGVSVLGPEKHSTRSDWQHVAPNGAQVVVEFRYGCLKKGVLNVEVTPVDINVPIETSVVRLFPTDACSRIRGVHGRRRVPPRRRARTVQASAGDSKAYFSNTSEVRSLPPPSPEKLQAELEDEAKAAREAGSLDVFQFNLAAAELAYKNLPNMMRTINDFKSAPQNADVLPPEGSRRLETYRIILGEIFELDDAPDEVDVNALLAAATDETITPSVRGSAVVALLNFELPAQLRERLLAFFRAQAGDSSSLMFSTAVIALGRIGTPEDRTKIIGDVASADRERRFASMAAIRAAQRLEGPEVLAEGRDALVAAARSSDDNETRAAAIEALRPFVLRLDEVAINVVVERLRDDSYVPVRIEAADALGVGQVEKLPRARVSLFQAVRQDSNKSVRLTAMGALNMPPQVNEF